jgi:ParB/RepB/Spo0J family partition protein
MSIASAQDGIRTLELEQLRLSNTGSQAERRRHFDKGAIEELADSIKTLGLVNPITARQVNGHFEIVAGERRFLAAKKAGLTAVTVSIRTLTDEQVIEVQLVENLQREGLHELAEAEGYEALQKLGHSAEETAVKVGKSKAYVYARMKLLALCQDSRKAFYDGKISASVALLLARIPVESTQKAALKEVTEDRFGNGALSYREASDLIQRQFMLGLAEAPFPTDQDQLVRGALPCGRCPKNTNSQPELFGDVKKGGPAGVCTDPSCFNAKKEAQAKQQIAAARASGQEVLEGKAAKEVFPHGTYQAHGGYVRLDSDQYANGQYRKVSAIVGKAVSPILVRAPSGELIHVVALKDLKDAMKAKGIKDTRPGASVNSQADKNARAKRAAEEKYRTAVLRQVLAKAPKELAREDLEAIARELFPGYGNDKPLFEQLGWDVPTGTDYRRFEKAAVAKIPKLTGPALNGLILFLLLRDSVGNQTFDGKHPGLEAAARRLKIDTAKIRKELAAVTPSAKKAEKKAKSK